MKICPAIQLVLRHVAQLAGRKVHQLDGPLDLTVRPCGPEIWKKTKITIKRETTHPTSL
jgi:hypothetical protein